MTTQEIATWELEDETAEETAKFGAEWAAILATIEGDEKEGSGN